MKQALTISQETYSQLNPYFQFIVEITNNPYLLAYICFIFFLLGLILGLIILRYFPNLAAVSADDGEQGVRPTEERDVLHSPQLNLTSYQISAFSIFYFEGCSHQNMSDLDRDYLNDFFFEMKQFLSFKELKKSPELYHCERLTDELDQTTIEFPDSRLKGSF